VPDRALPRWTPSSLQRTSAAAVVLGVLCLLLADIEISTLDPWTEMARLGLGLVTPDFSATDRLFEAFLHTVAFALLGVALGNVAGFLLALLFHLRAVRVGCAVIRAVHELFWALLFLQILGLTPWTGVLAIALPYAGIIAKVYAEILEESDPAASRALAPGTPRVSGFVYARVCDAFVHLRSYSLYRMECGLRSSAVLGFVGLPTLGFHLESAFAQGNYSEVSALLIVFCAAIATLRWWMRRRLLPLYLLAAVLLLPQGLPVSADAALRFLTHDIIPHPLRAAEQLDAGAIAALWQWLYALLTTQVLPGVANTLLLAVVALVATGALSLLLFPLISPHFFGPWRRGLGHVSLVVLRSTPEYILAYVLLQLWGPSMLPAILALSLHNGGIIAHLIGRFTEALPARTEAPRRALDRYFYVVLPQVYRQFLAFALYRFEVIMRETAILGMLGIATLGFFVDSAFADIRFDRAVVLIAVTALLNIAADTLSRRLRAGLRLRTSITPT
jgi:phosphonate transport system permease protein